MPINLLDIGCGYCHELDFLADDPTVRLFGLDVADAVLKTAHARLPEVRLMQADVRRSPLADESMDAVIGVNAMLYVPDHMLKAMRAALKKGGEAAVNFRGYENPHNRKFYENCLAAGTKLCYVVTDFAGHLFEVLVNDYRESTEDVLRRLDRQVYFRGRKDMERLISAAGFMITDHSSFRFASPMNPDNDEVDVYTLRKP